MKHNLTPKVDEKLCNNEAQMTRCETWLQEPSFQWTVSKFSIWSLNHLHVSMWLFSNKKPKSFRTRVRKRKHQHPFTGMIASAFKATGRVNGWSQTSSLTIPRVSSGHCRTASWLKGKLVRHLVLNWRPAAQWSQLFHWARCWKPSRPTWQGTTGCLGHNSSVTVSMLPNLRVFSLHLLVIEKWKKNGNTL